MRNTPIVTRLPIFSNVQRYTAQHESSARVQHYFQRRPRRVYTNKMPPPVTGSFVRRGRYRNGEKNPTRLPSWPMLIQWWCTSERYNRNANKHLKPIYTSAMPPQELWTSMRYEIRNAQYNKVQAYYNSSRDGKLKTCENCMLERYCSKDDDTKRLRALVS